jgi:hypothetical protein
VTLAAPPFVAQSSGVVNRVFAADGHDGLTATPWVYDPGHTHIVASQWVQDLGLNGANPGGNGLILSKNGTTPTNASAGASVNGVKGITLTELGFDERGNFALNSGGHCGAGATRFNVVTTDGVTHFLGGCANATKTQDTPAQGWFRVRIDPTNLGQAFPPVTPTEKVKSIDLVFDEGTDTGPDFSGFAILTNIDVNGQLFNGSTGHNGDNGNGNDNGQGNDNGND